MQVPVRPCCAVPDQQIVEIVVRLTVCLQHIYTVRIRYNRLKSSQKFQSCWQDTLLDYEEYSTVRQNPSSCQAVLHSACVAVPGSSGSTIKLLIVGFRKLLRLLSVTNETILDVLWGGVLI